MRRSIRKCLLSCALVVFAASVLFPPYCAVSEIQTQPSTSTIKNVAITILVDSATYEKFAAWIAPYGEGFHNFTFIIDSENSSFQWFLGNQTRIEFLTGIGEVIPLLSAVSPDGYTPGYIQTVSPAERIQIVDRTINEWKTSLGHVPSGVFMFQPDTLVSNHLESQNVTYILGYCFEQYTVDWMTMRGGWQLPYYASSEHALMPENQSKFGTLILPWLTWDWIDSLTLSHNYNTHIIDTRDSQLNLTNPDDYIIQLIDENLASCSPIAYSAFSFEFDWLDYYASTTDSSIFDEVNNILNHLIGNNSYPKLSADNFTKWFTQNYEITPTYSVSFTSPHSNQSIEWFYSQSSRVARTNGTVFSFVDYTKQQEDKYLNAVATVNFSEPRSITNCIDNSLIFSIDALGGGMYRAPVQGQGVEYSGNLADFMESYYNGSPEPGTTQPPQYPVLPSFPSSTIVSPTPTPVESPEIPENMGVITLVVLTALLTCFALFSRIKLRHTRSQNSLT